MCIPGCAFAILLRSWLVGVSFLLCAFPFFCASRGSLFALLCDSRLAFLVPWLPRCSSPLLCPGHARVHFVVVSRYSLPLLCPERASFHISVCHIVLRHCCAVAVLVFTFPSFTLSFAISRCSSPWLRARYAVFHFPVFRLVLRHGCALGLLWFTFQIFALCFPLLCSGCAVVHLFRNLRCPSPVLRSERAGVHLSAFHVVLSHCCAQVVLWFTFRRFVLFFAIVVPWACCGPLFPPSTLLFTIVVHKARCGLLFIVSRCSLPLLCARRSGSLFSNFSPCYSPSLRRNRAGVHISAFCVVLRNVARKARCGSLFRVLRCSSRLLSTRHAVVHCSTFRVVLRHCCAPTYTKISSCSGSVCLTLVAKAFSQCVHTMSRLA